MYKITGVYIVKKIVVFNFKVFFKKIKIKKNKNLGVANHPHFG